MKYDWQYGENEFQRFYDVTVNNNYLCVFENKWAPGTWMGMWNNNLIRDKVRNDRQRKKQRLPKGCPSNELRADHVLSNKDAEYMMRKVEYCFRHSLLEITP